MTETHHERCYQRRPEGIPDDLPQDLCDCRILWMFEGSKAVAAGGTCPTQCATLNHPGREHEEWLGVVEASCGVCGEADPPSTHCHCSYMSFSGVDQTDLSDTTKLWKCDNCGRVGTADELERRQ